MVLDVVVDRELVSGRHLIGHAQVRASEFERRVCRTAGISGVGPRFGRLIEVHARDVLVVLLLTPGRVVPKLVLLDGAAGRPDDVVDDFQAVGLDALCRLLRADVVGLHAVVGEAALKRAPERVAARLRNHVRHERSVRTLGETATDLDADFFDGAVVDENARPVAADAAAMVVRHPVHQELGLLAPAVVHRDDVGHERDAADVAEIVGDDARQQKRELPEVAVARRQRVDHVALQHSLVRHGLHVDHGRLARDGQRFLDRPDPQVCVHCCRERPRQHDALALDRREARQGECHGIRARPQVHDLVDPFTVGRDRAHFLDQRGAGRFNRDAGQHAAAGVSDHAGDRALRERGVRCDHDPGCHRHDRFQQRSAEADPRMLVEAATASHVRLLARLIRAG